MTKLGKPLSETEAKCIVRLDPKRTQETLGGNFKTSLVVTCSRSSLHAEETLSALTFATRAKSVCNHVKVHEDKITREKPLSVFRNVLIAERARERVIHVVNPPVGHAPSAVLTTAQFTVLGGQPAVLARAADDFGREASA